MKIKVSNLGPIRGPAEFDLKPLTILIGPNNAGKTWLAYTLGGIFSTYGISRYVRGDEIEDISKNYLSLTKAIDELLITGIAKIDLCQFADEYSETYFNNIALHAAEWLFEFMSTQQVSFNELELSIKLEETKQQIIDRVLASPLKSDIGLQKQTSDIDEDPKPLLRINKRKGQRELHLYTFSEGHIDEKIPRELIEEHLARNVLHRVHQALYSGVMFLPTERATFLPFLPSRFHLLAKTATTEEVGKEHNSMKSLSVPVATYLDFVMETYYIGTKHKTKRAKEVENTPAINEYIQLSQMLEEHILGGRLDFSTIDPTPAREIIFQPTGSTQTLEISVASSMVQQLTSLVFYLRYFAKPDQLLIIDEPEMNLHPKAQVQVLELLSMLVNAGLHVLITTHSPYITDHLLSLTKADEHTDKEAISAKFFLHDKRAFISKEQVSFYSVDQGKIIDAMDEDSDWNTFGKVSDTISDVYFSL